MVVGRSNHCQCGGDQDGLALLRYVGRNSNIVLSHPVVRSHCQ